jgi:hypothetical protein
MADPAAFKCAGVLIPGHNGSLSSPSIRTRGEGPPGRGLDKAPENVYTVITFVEAPLLKRSRR